MVINPIWDVSPLGAADAWDLMHAMPDLRCDGAFLAAI